MNNGCTHYKSLVPIEDGKEYFCLKCGWKFSITHIIDTEFEKLIEDTKELGDSGIVKIIEEALRNMGKTREEK
jgi:hypothetical protein